MFEWNYFSGLVSIILNSLLSSSKNSCSFGFASPSPAYVENNAADFLDRSNPVAMRRGVSSCNKETAGRYTNKGRYPDSLFQQASKMPAFPRIPLDGFLSDTSMSKRPVVFCCKPKCTGHLSVEIGCIIKSKDADSIKGQNPESTHRHMSVHQTRTVLCRHLVS